MDHIGSASWRTFVERQLKLNPNDSCGTHSPVVNLSQHNRREGPYRLCWERMMTSRFGRGTIHFLIVVELNYSCRQTNISSRISPTRTYPCDTNNLTRDGVVGVVDTGMDFTTSVILMAMALAKSLEDSSARNSGGSWFFQPVQVSNSGGSRHSMNSVPLLLIFVIRLETSTGME